MASSAPSAQASTGAQQQPGANTTGEEERYVAFRAGGDMGYARIEDEDFVSVNAQALLRVWNFRFGLVAPLRINVSRLGLRQRDWDETRDFARVPQCLRLDLGDYDRPADRFDPACMPYAHSGEAVQLPVFSMRFAPINGVTFGEGTLVNGLAIRN